MRTCKLCRSTHDSERDFWPCRWCPSEVCEKCYVDHTSTHEAIHSPYITKKRRTEKCGHPEALISVANPPQLFCDLPWGHDEDMHCANSADPDKKAMWPRMPDDRWPNK